MGNASSNSSTEPPKYDFEKWRYQHDVAEKFANDPETLVGSFMQMRKNTLKPQDFVDFSTCLRKYSSNKDISNEEVSVLVKKILEEGAPHLNEEILGDALGFERLSVKDRAVGVLLSVMIGDSLGARVEGLDHFTIQKWFPDGIMSFYPGTHMGIRHLGIKYGEYTDDTQATLALAQSLAHRKTINGPEIALAYAQFWKKNGKGCPDTAQKLMQSLLDGADYRKTGTSSFPDGSFANGGAMRISPVGIIGRDLDAEQIRRVAIEATRSTHVHPESIDGSTIIATAIAYCFHREAKDIDRADFLKHVCKCIESLGMKSMMQKVQSALEKSPTSNTLTKKDMSILHSMKLLDFQLKSVQAVPFVIYCFLRWYENPCQCLINTINLGGDTDTTGSILGGILGALHGTEWIPHRFFDRLENGDNGRDYAIGLALALTEEFTFPSFTH